METQEKFKTYADVFGELPRNVQYNLRGAVCKTLNIKASDFYRLLAYVIGQAVEDTQGTFFFYFAKLIKDWGFLCENPKLRKALDNKQIYFGVPKSLIKAEREYIAQARNEAVIQNRPAPELYPETFLKPHWNANKTALVTRHGVTHTQCPKPPKRLRISQAIGTQFTQLESAFFRNGKYVATRRKGRVGSFDLVEAS